LVTGKYNCNFEKAGFVGEVYAAQNQMPGDNKGPVRFWACKVAVTGGELLFAKDLATYNDAPANFGVEIGWGGGHPKGQDLGQTMPEMIL
jgi:hypothetical protein